MPAKPKTIDDYLARVSATQRAALEKLRRDIKAAASAAEECISYDILGYRLGSRLLVSFGAAKNHCAFYPGAQPHQGTKSSLSRDGSSWRMQARPKRRIAPMRSFMTSIL